MTDIVERLRMLGEHYRDNPGRTVRKLARHLREAADEIERLREVLDQIVNGGAATERGSARMFRRIARAALKGTDDA